MKIKIAKLMKDGLQTRVALDEKTVADYADAMRDGAKFPPVKVYKDTDGTYYLADGFHRVAAAQAVGRESIEAEEQPGTFIDALDWALSCNAKHGKRVTNADKQNAMRMAWEHRQELFGGVPSAGLLAQKCGVTKPTASKFINERNAPVSVILDVDVSNIVADKGLLARAALDEKTVEDYAEAMRDGEQFPPVKAYDIGGDKLVLADGWHRLEAARRAGLATIAAEVLMGSATDVLRCTLSCNAKHGRRVTNEDKRRMLEMAWEHRQELFGGKPTSGNLATACCVHRNTAIKFINEKCGGAE